MASKISEDELKTTMNFEVVKTEDTSDNVEDDKFQKTVEEHMQKTRKQFEMVKSKSDQAYTLWKQDFEFLESKRKNFTEMSQKLKDVHFNDVVKLNIGGEMFATSLETLTKFPNSLFGKMYSGSTKLKQGSDGTYFIDRDSTQFRESSIIEDNPEWRIQLNIWLKEKQRESVPQQFYSAETDGWTAAKFHELCENKGPTLLLMKSEHGCVFGGFTNISWGPSVACSDGKSFVFSFLSEEFKAPVIMSSDSLGGVKVIASSGPSFFPPILNSSRGHRLSSESTVFNVVSEPNVNSCSFVSTYGFQCPQELPNTKTFLAGAESFLLTNFEVYAV